MKHFETISTVGRGFAKSLIRDQYLSNGGPLSTADLNRISQKTNAYMRMLRDNRLKLTEQQEITRSYLHKHGIQTREIHGKLYAYDEYWDTIKKVHGGEWVNATAWTLQDALDFLGY